MVALLTPAHSNLTNGGDSENPSANRQFTSPEETWALYRDALLKGNYELAKKCCCPGKIKQVFVFERMRDSKRQRILQNMISIKKVYQQEEKAKYQIIREVNGVEIASFVYFARIDNEWKIDHH
jgi:hypothetical protein